MRSAHYLILAVALVAAPHVAAAQGAALRFGANGPREYEFADQRVLPPTFGRGEFTLELWVKPDTSFAVGEVSRGTIDQLTKWSVEDTRPYSHGGWWHAGNWLLDGFSRPEGFGSADTRAGSFGLQFYGGGRIRWTFADDDLIVPLGKVWAVQAAPASRTASLLDGQWHHVACVRRWAPEGGAILELWVDGGLVSSTRIPQRVDMRQFWDKPPHPRNPANLGGWAWGSEVMTAWGMYFTQYEDYKGLVDELRFWDRALSSDELRSRPSLSGSEPGLVGWWPFDEGSGEVARDRLERARVIMLHPKGSTMWSAEAVSLQR